MSWIRLKNISKSYGRTTIFREIHFKLGPDDKVGLVGRNGAGKTTLIKLILGEEAPDEGTVDISDGVAIGYFSQFSELDSDTTRGIIDLISLTNHDLGCTFVIATHDPLFAAVGRVVRMRDGRVGEEPE